jgi:hypothetical protein
MRGSKRCIGRYRELEFVRRSWYKRCPQGLRFERVPMSMDRCVASRASTTFRCMKVADRPATDSTNGIRCRDPMNQRVALFPGEMLAGWVVDGNGILSREVA